jgi:hypothetical protein
LSLISRFADPEDEIAKSLPPFPENSLFKETIGGD